MLFIPVVVLVIAFDALVGDISVHHLQFGYRLPVHTSSIYWEQEVKTLGTQEIWKSGDEVGKIVYYHISQFIYCLPILVCDEFITLIPMTRRHTR
jgi:hypothetical protein